jgi:hypothetical protein
MSQLIKRPELAGELREYLEKQADEGHQWLVYDTDNPISGEWDLHCFKSQFDALDFEREYQQIGNWHEVVPIGNLVYGLKEIEYSLKDKDMNRNVEERFRQEATDLKIPKEMIEEAVGLMEKGLPYIRVQGQLPAVKGSKELTIQLKEGGRYNNYFLNKYDLALTKAKPLEEDKKYMVISRGEDGKPSVKNFKSLVDAIDNFQKREGSSELAVGKSLKDYMSLATMKDGKVDYVTKDFQAVYYSPPVTNTVYVDSGVGFNVVQAGNMLEGGSAYRSDLVSRVGKEYEAYNTYRFNEPRDKYGNLKIKQFSEGYGFDLKKELENYRIKGLDAPEKFNAVLTAMNDGERPVVIAVNEKGEETMLRVQAMPRFGNVNFYHLNGKPENREQFQKEGKLGKDQSQDKAKDKSQEMAM